MFSIPYELREAIKEVIFARKQHGEQWDDILAEAIDHLEDVTKNAD